mgnify:CR=1 FL=1
MSEFTEEEKEAAEKAEADAIAEQEASEAQAAEKAKAEKIDMEDVETKLIDIITTSPGTITGKGLVKAGTVTPLRSLPSRRNGWFTTQRLPMASWRLTRSIATTSTLPLWILTSLKS